MMLSSFMLILVSVICIVAATSSVLETRDSNTTAPALTITIKDHTGQDVTSSFKTLLYVEPRGDTAGNLNDRQVNHVRAISTCGETEGIFVESRCNHQDQVRGSLRAYTYRCLTYAPNPRNPRYGHRLTTPYAGDCHDDEICVNGIGTSELIGHAHVGIAHCIKLEAYTKLANSRDPEQLDKLANLKVDVIFSGADKKTPLKADSIDTEAGASALGGAKGSTQSKSCLDCLDLTTDKLPPMTDFLKTEVKLVTTGLAAAGILWLTVLAG